MSIRAIAPASTANLGPAFDAAGAALELWNEVVVEEIDDGPVVEVEGEGAGELRRDGEHLSLRAFALLAPVTQFKFTFVNRIPLERGLGSSAAAIAIGLVAGRAAAGVEASPAELLALGMTLESHPDNLAAALLGGVCLAWRQDGEVHAARISTGLPLASILAIPAARTSTGRSRDGLPPVVVHGDAAANAGFAALLGAAIASDDAALLTQAFNDRLHEQYRVGSSPLLSLLRSEAPDGVAGVTLSGSGPSVVVWTAPDRESEVAAALERSLPADTLVLPLRVAPEGARLR